ncbi:hypothetical protein K443DRAFT_123087 [Laccaria amethystina LaAM-08-1]|uniref:DUF6589 domain-containing protein n=1 Tax=Laccaria amethystina LaAM-08-1 TaxID=1095629 RepID=A0A0C9WPA0_9AGAR|nr:hypothetical protein K443DRAFT_123087 [Laccaria amethystina LaAM-08-1]
MASILNAIYERSLDVTFRTTDMSVKPGTNMFNPDIELHQIQHATPAMTTWAVRHVAMVVQGESEKIVDEKAGLHLRAHEKEGGQAVANRISWEAIQHFSFKKLQETAQKNSPAMSFLLDAYTNKDFLEDEVQGRVAVMAHVALVFGHLNCANLYPICCGIWMFATKAANTNFRVDSCIGLCVTHSTVYEALKEMARQKGIELKKAVELGKCFIVVFDNVQAYMKQRDHRIGRESLMITGLAATAVEMEDYAPEAFDLKDLLNQQVRQERKQLTTELIMQDLDFQHLAKVTKVHFLQCLTNFVPALAVYKKRMADLSKGLEKTQIPPTHKSKITLLATNSADKMHVQGLKQGVLDFLNTQMGITADNLNDKVSFLSGDRKTYVMLLLLKKLLSLESSDYESLRWIYPLLELWHAKWTDLSHVVHAHWGSTDDPSSLASVAKISNCPTPSDLQKVDFFEGSHSVNLALDAHILVCWEVYLKTDNLIKHFETLSLQKQLPSFEDLETVAEVLSRHHATTQAYSCACFPSETQTSFIPEGSPWTGTSSMDVVMGEISTSESVNVSTTEDVSTTNKLLIPPESNDGDLTLANSTLFIRDGIWWREVCIAVAEGDPGRVWEVMKLWIFTFAGSGNPNYSNFLLKLYCSFK